MKRVFPPMVLILAIAALLFGAAMPASAPTPDAITRGVALGMFATDPGYDYGGMLEEVRARGATDVLLVVNWYQRDVHAHSIAPLEGKSPTGQNITRTIRQAHALGMRVTLMPVVRLERRQPNQWRGVISPAAGADAWFDSYQGFLAEMTRIAASEQIARLVIGSELASMLPHELQWRQLIAGTRARFDGELLYSANWDNFENVPFWDALDVAGVTGYFELAAPDEVADRDALLAAWQGPRAKLAMLRERLGKPVVLTEIGYAAHEQAAARPWDEQGAGGAPSLSTQAMLYGVFCDAMAPSGAIDGYYFWNWFGFGGPSDASFTPRGKPAAAQMEACLRRETWRAPSSPETPRQQERG